MKILYAGIFKDHELGGDIIFEKGLVLNGCEVERFDYRSIIKDFGKEKMYELLLEKVKSKDVLFIGKGEVFTPNILNMVKKLGITIVLWYGDIRMKPELWLIEILQSVDFYFMSSADEILKEYYMKGKPKVAAYYFNPSDYDLVKKYSMIGNKKNNKITFTGTFYDFAGSERRQTIRYLLNRKDVVFYGDAPILVKEELSLSQRLSLKFNKNKYRNWVRGTDYIKVIKSSKMGIGVNAIQNIPGYTSDRLSHYLMFGTLFLVWDIPKIEVLFKKNEEIIVFKDIEDLNSKIEYYLREEDERKFIELNAQNKMLKEYNSKNVVGMMLDIVNKGYSDRFPWVQVFK